MYEAEVLVKDGYLLYVAKGMESDQYSREQFQIKNNRKRMSMSRLGVNSDLTHWKESELLSLNSIGVSLPCDKYTVDVVLFL